MQCLSLPLVGVLFASPVKPNCQISSVVTLYVYIHMFRWRFEIFDIFDITNYVKIVCWTFLNMVFSYSFSQSIGCWTFLNMVFSYSFSQSIGCWTFLNMVFSYSFSQSIGCWTFLNMVFSYSFSQSIGCWTFLNMVFSYSFSQSIGCWTFLNMVFSYSLARVSAARTQILKLFCSHTIIYGEYFTKSIVKRHLYINRI